MLNKNEDVNPELRFQFLDTLISKIDSNGHLSDEDMLLIQDLVRQNGMTQAHIANVATALDIRYQGSLALLDRSWDRARLAYCLLTTRADYIATLELARKMVADNQNDIARLQPVQEPDWRNNPWGGLVERPAAQARGPKPGYRDTNRPEGQRIIPSSPDGCVQFWVGPSGSYKTATALTEGLQEVKRGGRVLYLALEDFEGVKTLRLPAACTGYGIKIDELWPADESMMGARWITWGAPFELLRPAKPDDDEIMKLVVRFQYQRPTIIFVDVVTRAIGTENISAPEVGIGIITSLERLASLMWGATVIALTHPTEGSNDPFGSKMQKNLGYNVLSLRYDNRTDIQTIHVTKAKNGPQGFDVFMRNVPAADGTAIMFDVPAAEVAALRARGKTAELALAEGAGEDAGDGEPTPAAADTGLRDRVLAALDQLGAGPQPVPAVVRQMTGVEEKATQQGKSLGQSIRRNMKRGCLVAFAVEHGGHLALSRW